MRGDLSLHLGLLARPQGVVGLVGVVAGATAFAAAYLPWYDVAATVEVLGSSGMRAVASLAGWESHPWGWVVPALALAAMAFGIGIAIDRPPPGNLLLWTGLGLAAAVAGGGLLFPPVDRFDVAGSRLRELAALADRLPRDVDLTFSVRPAVGLWLTLAAAALVVAAALAERDA